MLLHYKHASAAAMQKGLLLWNVTLKQHFLIHTAMICKYYNPRRYWNYADEDFVGRIAKLASSRGGPKAAATTTRKLLEAYRALGT